MRILTHLDDLAAAAAAAPVALAAGFFDGVHRGHLRVLETTLEEARAIDGEAWALTFEPHPVAVLAPAAAPTLLTSTGLRLERLAASGLDGCLLLRFTRAMAGLSPRDFVQRVLCREDWHPHTVFAGDNWRFGAGGSGCIRTLPELSDGRIRAGIVPPVIDHGQAISSTRIRSALLQGDLETANRLLGRPYRLQGVVGRGRGVGRRMGVATANLRPRGELLPGHGIYALWAAVGGGVHPAVCHIGNRPTFTDARPTEPLVEVHLMDFEGDLYGLSMDIALTSRIRPEARFATPEQLVAQIRSDIAVAWSLLDTAPRPADLFNPPLPVPSLEPFS